MKLRITDLAGDSARKNTDDVWLLYANRLFAAFGDITRRNNCMPHDFAKPRKRRADKGFLFSNFATCGCCGYSILAERHVKKSGLRFDYYRCSHKG